MTDWMTIRVVLTGNADGTLAAPPGRVLLAHADHTFAELAEAIDVALARWDLTPPHEFAVEGRRLVSADLQDEFSAEEPGADVEDSDDVTLGEVGLREGSRFAYLFDLGERWLHDCVVEEIGVDPIALTGEEPEVPVPVFGWGTVPDQYSRETEPETDAWADVDESLIEVVERALAEVERPRDEAGLAAALARLRAADNWSRDVLWSAAGLDPDAQRPVDEDLWLDLVAGVVAPQGEVPVDADTAAAWSALEPADWAAAVIELVRRGPGSAAEPERVLELIQRCPEVEEEDLSDEDEDVLLAGLDIAADLLSALGAIDEQGRLTRLGCWGLPLALERAWRRSHEPPGGPATAR